MSTQPSPTPPKPTLPPFWKWLMRVTFVLTMTLFLAPAFYVVKYYAVDKPREELIVKKFLPSLDGPQMDPDYLLRTSRLAKDSHRPTSSRQWSIFEMGYILRHPGVSYKRPLECLLAKATLADLATKDPDPAVRATASLVLGKVAQGGAVIRR